MYALVPRTVLLSAKCMTMIHFPPVILQCLLWVVTGHTSLSSPC